jgi:hypothetical protein
MADNKHRGPTLDSFLEQEGFLADSQTKAIDEDAVRSEMPNAETRAAMESARVTMKAHRVGFTDPQELLDALDDETRLCR